MLSHAIKCKGFKIKSTNQFVTLIELPSYHRDIEIEEKNSAPPHIWNSESIASFENEEEFELALDDIESTEQQQQHHLIPPIHQQPEPQVISAIDNQIIPAPQIHPPVTGTTFATFSYLLFEHFF